MGFGLFSGKISVEGQFYKKRCKTTALEEKKLAMICWIKKCSKNLKSQIEI